MTWHPNKVQFEGALTVVDVASDKAPSGARGHRVILTREAAEEALPGLIGMAVDFRPELDGHNARLKCGVIEAAEFAGAALRVRGYLFARDFPDLIRMLDDVPGRDVLGMSYELADAHVENMRKSVWTLTKATFTGAAILLRSKAAYRRTSFRLVRGNDEPFALAAACRMGYERPLEFQMIVPEEDEFEEGCDEETEEVFCAGAD